MLQAIETNYRGYRFRSRLEARWAVFFDALEWRWEYEPEGYRLPTGEVYLPDFRITGSPQDRLSTPHPILIEVKPNPPGDIHKPMLLANLTDLFIVSGPPGVRVNVWNKARGWYSNEFEQFPYTALIASRKARF